MFGRERLAHPQGLIEPLHPIEQPLAQCCGLRSCLFSTRQMVEDSEGRLRAQPCIRSQPPISTQAVVLNTFMSQVVAPQQRT